MNNGPEPMPAASPSPGWTGGQIAALVLSLVVTNAVTATAVYFARPMPPPETLVDPPLGVQTKTIDFFGRLDADQREAAISSPDTRGPFVIQSSSDPEAPEDCRLAVNDEEVHRSRCSRFHYEYRLQARAGVKITFEFTASIGIDDADLSLQITLQIELSATVDVNGTLFGSVRPELGTLLGFGYASTERGPYSQIADEPLSLAPGKSTNFTRVAQGWVWINITVTVEVTYEVRIEGKLVVEGGCAGGVVNAYAWIEQKTEFSVDVNITATGGSVDGTLVIEGMTK